jgi:type I restriction enzyme, S subunit
MADSSLSDYADIVMGQSPPGETCSTTGPGLPLLNGPTEYGPHHPSPVQFTTDTRKRARPGDVLFCVRGSTTGRMNWADREYAIGRGVAAIRHKREPELQPFVRAVIEYGLPGLLAQATGSTFPNVSADQLGRLWWPPLQENEQRAIAHILGSLDDKIDLNRRMSETLEAIARGLFKAWFVDFDPVRAKAEGRDSGVPEPLADLFSDSFEDSELGEIPTGWTLAPLPEVIDVNPNRALRKGVEAPYLDMANMPTRGHSPDEVVERPFGSGMRFINGDTLVARITPCLENGKTAYVDFLEDGQVGWGSTEYIVLRPKPPLPDEFAYCLARSEAFREFAIQSMTGSSGRQRVPAQSLSHFLVAAAPPQIGERFAMLVRPLFARACAAANESRSIDALRDTLLPQLISGGLRVERAEDLATAHL